MHINHNILKDKNKTIEVKHSATPKPAMSMGIRKFHEDLELDSQGYVIHAGSHRLPLGSDVQAIPFF